MANPDVLLTSLTPSALGTAFLLSIPSALSVASACPTEGPLTSATRETPEIMLPHSETDDGV